MAITCGKNAYWVAKRGIVQNGLVLNLDAAVTDSYPGYGTTWRDLSGNNNGTLTNGPTFSDANGGSIVFDGTNDYIALPNSPATQPTTPFTILAWFRRSTVGGSSREIASSQYYGGPDIFGWSWWIDSSNIMHGAIGNATATTLVDGSTSLNSTSTWYSAVFLWDGAAMRLFVNGNQDGSRAQTLGPVYGATNYAFIGLLRQNLDYYPWSGQIYNICIYNRALSQAEITQNFNATRSRFGV